MMDDGLLAIFGLVFGALPIVVGLIVAQYPAGALLWVGLAVGYVGMAASIFDPSVGPGVFVGAVLTGLVIIALGGIARLLSEIRDAIRSQGVQAALGERLDAAPSRKADAALENAVSEALGSARSSKGARGLIKRK